MSDDGSNLPTTISVDELAGRKRGETRHGTDDIDDLRRVVMDFCTAQGPPSPALSSARTNFDQAIFWLRSHRDHRAN